MFNEVLLAGVFEEDFSSKIGMNKDNQLHSFAGNNLPILAAKPLLR